MDQVRVCSPSASSIGESWFRMFLALTYSGQSRTMCLIECGSLHTDGLFFVFYDMYVGEVGMTDSCSGIDNFGTFKSYS